MNRWLLGHIILTSFFAGFVLDEVLYKLESTPIPGTEITLGPFTPKFATPKCEGGAFERMCEVELTPKIITLRFVAREDFELNRPVQNSIGYAKITNNPCEIVVPAVGVMTFNPNGTYVGLSGSFGFVRASGEHKDYHPYDAQQTLVHEILHCFAGLWHPSDKILNWYSYGNRLHRMQSPEVQRIDFLRRLMKDEPPFQLWDRIDPDEMKYWRLWKKPYEFVTVNR